jgi:hypothetical protein
MLKIKPAQHKHLVLVGNGESKTINSPICVGHGWSSWVPPWGQLSWSIIHGDWKFASLNKYFSCWTPSSCESTQRTDGAVRVGAQSMVCGSYPISWESSFTYSRQSGKGCPRGRQSRKGCPRGQSDVMWIWISQKEEIVLGWEKHLKRCSQPWVSLWSDHKCSLHPQTPETMTAPSNKTKIHSSKRRVVVQTKLYDDLRNGGQTIPHYSMSLASSVSTSF